MQEGKIVAESWVTGSGDQASGGAHGLGGPATSTRTQRVLLGALKAHCLAAVTDKGHTGFLGQKEPSLA